MHKEMKGPKRHHQVKRTFSKRKRIEWRQARAECLSLLLYRLSCWKAEEAAAAVDKNVNASRKNDGAPSSSGEI